jgi:hypothetical protein
MRAKISPGPNVPPQDAELIEVEEAKEAWNEYRLIDGSIIRVKQVATEVWRIEGAYDQEGNPQYVLKTAGVMTVHAPDSLKKKVN